MVVSATSAYARAKQLEEEKKQRKENGGGQWVNHFIELKDGESVRLRFLYNMLDEPAHEKEMLCFLMHDYFVQADNRFVRALCAQEDGKPCHWCHVAERELKKAQAMSSASTKKEALKAAHRKEAKEHFVLPCLVSELDENGKPVVGEDGKQVITSKLLDLKASILTDLMSIYDTGIEDEDESGNEVKLHDITVGDFLYKRSGAGTDTRYSILFTRVKRARLSPPTHERIKEMILECRPFQESIVPSSPDEVSEDDNAPF